MELYRVFTAGSRSLELSFPRLCCIFILLLLTCLISQTSYATDPPEKKEKKELKSQKKQINKDITAASEAVGDSVKASSKLEKKGKKLSNEQREINRKYSETETKRDNTGFNSKNRRKLNKELEKLDTKRNELAPKIAQNTNALRAQNRNTEELRSNVGRLSSQLDAVNAKLKPGSKQPVAAPAPSNRATAPPPMYDNARLARQGAMRSAPNNPQAVPPPAAPAPRQSAPRQSAPTQTGIYSSAGLPIAPTRNVGNPAPRVYDGPNTSLSNRAAPATVNNRADNGRRAPARSGTPGSPTAQRRPAQRGPAMVVLSKDQITKAKSGLRRGGKR